MDFDRSSKAKAEDQSLDDPYQMRNLRDRATHGRRVGPLNDLIQLPQSQRADDFLMFVGTGDRAPVILNLNLRQFSLLTLHEFSLLALRPGFGFNALLFYWH